MRWFVYLIGASLLSLLAWLFGAKEGFPIYGWAFYVGLWLTFLTMCVQHETNRSSVSARTLNALSTLRTDPSYLMAATVLRTHQPLGAPLSQEAKAALDAERPTTLPIPAVRSGTPPAFNPTFAEATDFVLNQCEFLAAGVREGAIDYHLLRATQRGVVLGLGLTFADYIRESREGAPRLWENFVYLFYRFAEHDFKYGAIDLGPRPERVWGRESYPPWLLEA